MFYTVIAYKPSGADYCRGCVIETWDSDFEHYIDYPPIGLIALLEDLIWKNKISKRFEPLWQISVYVQGTKLTELEYDDPIWITVRANIEQKYSEHKKLEEIKQQEILEQQRQQKEKAERKLLEELKIKYKELE